MEVFPEAKVVLTIRDPEDWYKSFSETIYQINLNSKRFPENHRLLPASAKKKIEFDLRQSETFKNFLF